MFRNFSRLSKRKTEVKTDVDEVATVDVDQAWETQNFDLVLRYLNKDSNFPKYFDYGVLISSGSDKGAKKLMAFCAKRAEIHRSIRAGDLKELKKLVSKSNSTLFLNKENESAVFTAVNNKKFEIFAYLKSIGADFKDKAEWDAFNNLEISEKTIVESHSVRYYPRNPRAPVFYLMSKSRPSKPMSDFEERVQRYYEKLNQIKEISEILQMVQNADYLDLVFDLDNDNISHLSHKSSENTRGECNYKEGRLYLAAGGKRTDEEILGTIAHEITHFALELMYENECNPYRKNDEINQSKFENVANKIREKMDRRNDLSAILSETFSVYPECDYHSELIVRVPQIIGQNEIGKDWLKAEAHDLFAFYLNVLKDCRNFVKNESCKLRVRRQIRLINEGMGEIQKIKQFPLTFENISEIGKIVGRKLKADFLKRRKSKNISVVAGESAWLCVLKALQGFYNDGSYVNYFDRYLLLKLQNFMKEKLEILKLFILDGSDLLVVEYSDEVTLSKREHDELEDLIVELFQYNKKKRIIFAIDNNTEPKMKEILQHVKYDYFKDSNLSLRDLDARSQEIILSKIFFQNKKLINLIKDKDSIEFEAKAIGEIISNGTIQIINDIPNLYKAGNFVMYEKIVIKLRELSECENVQTLINTDREKFLTIFRKNTGQEEDQNLEKILTRIVLAETEEEAQRKFDEYKKNDQIIYWLEIKDDKFIYKNSHGSLDNIRKSIDITNSKKCAVPETSFIEKLKDGKVIIVAGDPGSGKTIKSSENRYLYKNYWIIKVDIKDFIKRSKNADVADLLDYLTELHDKSIKNVIKSLLKFVINEEFAVPLFIFIDRFDEVLDESDRMKIILLLKLLKEETKVKFLITASLQYKDILEDNLSTFALEYQQ